MAHKEIGAAGRPIASHRVPERRQQFEPKPAHAGVEMQRRRRRLAAAGRKLGPALKLLGAADGGLEVICRIVVRIGVLFQAVEDIDDRFSWQDAPGGEAFAELGDEKDPGAGGPQRRAGLAEANPVGVGLDDGPCATGRGPAREPQPVLGKRFEIDRQAARRRFEGRVAHAGQVAFMSESSHLILNVS